MVHLQATVEAVAVSRLTETKWFWLQLARGYYTYLVLRCPQHCVVSNFQLISLSSQSVLEDVHTPSVSAYGSACGSSVAQCIAVYNSLRVLVRTNVFFCACYVHCHTDVRWFPVSPKYVSRHRFRPFTDSNLVSTSPNKHEIDFKNVLVWNTQAYALQSARYFPFFLEMSPDAFGARYTMIIWCARCWFSIEKNSVNTQKNG